MQNFNASNLISQRIHTKEKGWHNTKITLSQQQKDKFISIFGCRCKSKTIIALQNAINNNLYKLRYYGIVDRIMFEGEEVSYCPGQDYPGEIAFIRKIVLKHY